jgi:uncharacterized protein YndB with AHSA1/START domain
MRAGGDVTAPGTGSRTFACYSPVDPVRAWAALTDSTQTPTYLYGLALHSTWVPDAPIDIRHEDRPTLTGRTLCSRPHERLSYVLQAGPDDPTVYLTWLIRPSPGGCTIRLQLDEIDCADDADDADDTWLPVLAALQRLLAAH